MSISAAPRSAARPRRSALYVPGANARAMEKAATLACDIVIIDLEDAVASASKAQARDNAVRTLGAQFGHREVVVRINGLETQWGHDDVDAIAPLAPAAILLPKVESAAHVQDLAAVLRRSGGSSDLRIWAMIETPAAFFRLPEIADADPLIQAFVLGTTDLVADLRGRHTVDRAALLPLLSLAVCAARSRGLVALDGVHLKIDDEPGLLASCRQGRDLGFDGKSVIHPSHIGPTNSVYGPTADELKRARQRIEAFEAAVASGTGMAVVEGTLVEALHVREAQQLVELASAIEKLSS